jgi:Cdc6-like AAA superfamily ATPase
LIEIVQSRLIPHPNSTLEHKVLLPDAIALAATRMAGTNGDARRVLDACRYVSSSPFAPSFPTSLLLVAVHLVVR